MNLSSFTRLSFKRLAFACAGLVVAAALASAALPARVSAAASVNDGTDEICSQIQGGQTPPSICHTTEEDPLTGSTGLFIKAARLIAIITGAASIIIVILGGLRYVTANGDPQAITAARNQILYAVIGVIVSILAQALIIFIINRIKG